MQRGVCDKPSLSSVILGIVNGSSMGCWAVWEARTQHWDRPLQTQNKLLKNIFEFTKKSKPASAGQCCQRVCGAQAGRSWGPSSAYDGHKAHGSGCETGWEISSTQACSPELSQNSPHPQQRRRWTYCSA